MTLQIEYPANEGNQIHEIVERQKNFFSSHNTFSLEFRINQLKLLKKVIKDHERDIYDALYSDLHKPVLEAFSTEFGIILAELSLAIKKLKKWAKPKKTRGNLTILPYKSYIYSEPRGVILIMGPWNYPFQLMLSPVIGAIAAGNCVVIKPSEHAPETSHLIKLLISKTFSSDYIAVIEGDPKIGSALLKENFNYIFFTGGNKIGQIVYEEAAKQMIPVTLELGGKTPCIIDTTADLAKSASAITWGKFLNSGQTCIAPDYVLIHDSIKTQFIEEMKKKIIQFYKNNSAHTKDYGRIINDNQYNRLKSYLLQGKVIFGGETIDDEKYISPSIIEVNDLTTNIMREEIFGPILPVITYSNIGDAIKFVNDRPQPLSLYVFSNDKRQIDNITKSTSAGGMTVNDTMMHFVNPNLPFGGIGNSGIGAYHGKFSFDIFSHKKAYMRATNRVFTRIYNHFKYPPYTSFKLKVLKLLLK